MVEIPAAFHVGSIPIRGDLILAPMDGVTDSPFRLLARSLGSAMSYTEFINAMDILHPPPYLQKRLEFREEERPLVYQVFDEDPQRILQAALKLLPRKMDVLDINMGCSDRGVSGRGAGAGLLRTPEKITRIISTLSGMLDIPVTAKIRLGWSEETRNYREIAHILEDSGAKLIAVHARTRNQQFTGSADWDAIAEVKQLVKIPVIGNGDVKTVADIERLKCHTKCDGVMIGRAAVGNPWIFSRLDRQQVPASLVHQTVRQHLHALQGWYGERRGLLVFRKFAKGYLRPYGLETESLRSVLTCEDGTVFLEKIAGIFSYLENG